MSARDVFEAARRASRRIEELHFELEEPISRASSGQGVRTSSVGDPTARAAERQIERVPEILREIDACEKAISEALALIDGVRQAFETPWWRVLELHYIDGMSWPEVSEEMCLSRATCVRWRDAAFDWIDFVGDAKARRGMGSA